MRWIKRGLLVFAGLIVIMICGVIALDRIEDDRAERFYAAHPVLRAMRDAPPLTERGNRSWPQMNAVLARYIPPGSSRAEAQQILLTENLSCSPYNERERQLSCFVGNEPSIFVPRYHIQISFDQGDNVVGGRVLALK